MLEILLNPITLSVIVMCVLCLFKLNVILSLLVASMVAGITAGMKLDAIMGTIINGLNSNGTNAIAYFLLGVFAIALTKAGLANVLSNAILKLVRKNKILLLVIMTVAACISGTLIPIHIAYIPILYPALLGIMNDMKMDRRQAAVATEFGLIAPYISIPIGYGIIFQGIIADNMTQNGMPVKLMEVWPYTFILMIGLLVGLIVGVIYYNKDRNYDDKIVSQDETNKTTGITRDYIVSIIAIAVVLFGQLYFDSMPLGALMGVLVMIIGGVIKLDKSDEAVSDGIKLMGQISFIMLIAGGYASVVRETGAVDSLINNTISLLGNNRPVFLIVLILIGLLITMGIGTSFGTIPVIAIVYVPLCAKMGLSVGATICLIACAAALGDAGSPASDSTLGPTAGLNADMQHDHIKDTCIPTFVFYNVPLIVAGFIGGMIF